MVREIEPTAYNGMQEGYLLRLIIATPNGTATTLKVVHKLYE
jgi:hypothetical protein